VSRARCGILHFAEPGPYQIKRVIAGLDPAIHPLRKSLAKMMDARVKPAHDEVYLYLHIG
jgi:hypothetical protein